LLPAGLIFNYSTGTISGIPTSASPATNYMVTAYNAGGGSTATVNIKLLPSSNANLVGLTLSSGILSPAFASGTTSYTALVNTPSVTVTPVAGSAGATVKVNGSTVASGMASQIIPLALGGNVITTVVTASDGVTTKTYTVAVTRLSNNATLASLKINGGAISLTPAFASGTTSYAANATNVTTSITVTPITNNGAATIKVNGTAVVSKNASSAIPLNVGVNTVNTVVTAQDGATTKTYTIMVTRALSANTNLSNLKINAGAISLSPAFNYATTNYTASVTNATTSIKVTPAAADVNATVKINGTVIKSGTASAALSLKVGTNTINTIVTAQNGTNTKLYIITVTRAPSANASLASLSISGGTLSPAFASGTTNYTATVGTASVTVTPTTSDATAKVTVNGTGVTSGAASGTIPLVVGSNTITTMVIAQDGTTTDMYTLTVTRLSNNANLSNLKISSGTINPVFNYNTTGYTATVTNATTSITVTPFTSDANATIRINGIAVASKAASQPIALNPGPNIITTVVTAQNGT